METLFIPYYLCIHDDKKHFFMKRNGSKIFELFCELEKFMGYSSALPVLGFLQDWDAGVVCE